MNTHHIGKYRNGIIILMTHNPWMTYRRYTAPSTKTTGQVGLYNLDGRGPRNTPKSFNDWRSGVFDDYSVPGRMSPEQPLWRTGLHDSVRRWSASLARIELFHGCVESSRVFRVEY